MAIDSSKTELLTQIARRYGTGDVQIAINFVNVMFQSSDSASVHSGLDLDEVGSEDELLGELCKIIHCRHCFISVW